MMSFFQQSMALLEASRSFEQLRTLVQRTPRAWEADPALWAEYVVARTRAGYPPLPTDALVTEGDARTYATAIQNPDIYPEALDLEFRAYNWWVSLEQEHGPGEAVTWDHSRPRALDRALAAVSRAVDVMAQRGYHFFDRHDSQAIAIILDAVGEGPAGRERNVLQVTRGTSGPWSPRELAFMEEWFGLGTFEYPFEEVQSEDEVEIF